MIFWLFFGKNSPTKVYRSDKNEFQAKRLISNNLFPYLIWKKLWNLKLFTYSPGFHELSMNSSKDWLTNKVDRNKGQGQSYLRDSWFLNLVHGLVAQPMDLKSILTFWFFKTYFSLMKHRSSQNLTLQTCFELKMNENILGAGIFEASNSDGPIVPNKLDLSIFDFLIFYLLK